LHSIGRLEDGREIPFLGTSLHWCPNHSLIASSEIRKDKLFIIFFERNGLRHGEFQVPLSNEWKVQQVSWNIESDVLSVLFQQEETQQSILQLWTRNNYHWYLKQERRYKELVKKVRWDEEKALLLHVLKASNCQYEQILLTWDVAVNENDPNCTFGVIDGKKLLLTPFTKAMVPPPMAFQELEVDHPINSFVFASNTTCAALLADNSIVLVNTSTKEIITVLDFGSQTIEKWNRLLGIFASSLFVQSESNKLFEISLSAEKLRPILQSPYASVACAVSVSDGFYFQTEDGVISHIHPNEPEPEPVMDNPHVFRKLAIIDSNNVFGLVGNKLYLNDALVCSSCSSFYWSESMGYLLYVTLGSFPQLRLLSRQAILDGQLHLFEARKVERGGKIIAAIPHRADVILQMPRGNLEIIAPRVLVLSLVCKFLQSSEHAKALEMCRKHRVDLNVIVDYAPKAFESQVEKFILEIPALNRSDRLSLFITALHDVDVWETKYKRQLFPSNDESLAVSNDQPKMRSKVNRICQAFVTQILTFEQNNGPLEQCYLLPLLTCFVKQSPSKLPDALLRVQQLLSENGTTDAKSALKHLMFLVDFEDLYHEALGLYDLKLVRFVALYAQKDPKEYMQFLDLLQSMDNESYRKYSIDVSLKRYASALHHLARAGDEHIEKCVALIQEANLFDDGLKIFSKEKYPHIHQFILQMKAEHLLKVEKQSEQAGYVFLSAGLEKEAIEAFRRAKKWQMALLLAAKIPEYNITELAYEIAQKLLMDIKNTKENTLAAAEIYVNYCRDLEEAISVLINQKEWKESLRLAHLHKRFDLVETDIKPAVLRVYEEMMEDLETQSTNFIKHFTRLTTIRDQKRLFRLYGIDGGTGHVEQGQQDAESLFSGASSAAGSAMSTDSVSSVGSHNSAFSIANFSLKNLSQATSSHFYATSTSVAAATAATFAAKTKRTSRRVRITPGSIEEEKYIEKQLEQCKPSKSLVLEIANLLKMLVYFNQVDKASKLQVKLEKLSEVVRENKPPAPLDEPQEPKTTDATQDVSWELPFLYLYQ
jgi:elongator complex protein 1